MSGNYIFLDHTVKHLERFGNMSLTDAALFEQFNALYKQSYKMKSRPIDEHARSCAGHEERSVRSAGKLR